MQKGRFITFEGGEGTGKSTQIKLLAHALEERGISVLTTREPGGSSGAEKIRELLVKGEPNQWDPLTEALLFLAARRDHVEKVIKPALKKGQWVISDRYHDSTVTYTGYGHGVDLKTLEKLYTLIIGDFTPDKVIILDIDPHVGLSRAVERGGEEDRIEKKGLAFHKKVREGYLTLASHDSEHYVVISADQSVETVHQAILTKLKRFIFG